MRRLASFTAAAIVACTAPVFAQDEMQPAKAPPGDAPSAKMPAKDKTITLKVGDAAPAISIEKWVKGKEVSSFESGKVYVVEFWATWCGPCIKSMPHLTQLQKEYGDKGVTIIGVTSKDPRNSLPKVEKMVEAKGDVMGYTVAWDNGRATKDAYLAAAGQDSIPCSFVVDKAGKIAHIGHPTGLDLVLSKVIAGTWDAKTDSKNVNDAVEKLWALVEQSEDDPKGALASLKELDASHPGLTKDMDDLRYSLLAASGDGAEASKVGTRVVDHLGTAKDSESLNEFAWNMVDPQANVKFKDYDLALRAATKANEITEGKNAAILDTLARCYFVKGDRAKAIENQKKALAAAEATDPDNKGEIEETLREYEKGSN